MELMEEVMSGKKVSVRKMGLFLLSPDLTSSYRQTGYSSRSHLKSYNNFKQMFLKKLRTNYLVIGTTKSNEQRTICKLIRR